MNETNVRGIQQVVDRASKCLLGLSAKSRLAGMATLRSELHIPPVAAIAAGQRARALAKFPSLRTWISTLIAYPLRDRKRSWLTLSKQWMTRYYKPSEGQAEEGVPNPRVCGRQVKKIVWKRMSVQAVKAKTFYGEFERRKMVESQGYIRQALAYPEMSIGVVWLAKCRTNAIFTV